MTGGSGGVAAPAPWASVDLPDSATALIMAEEDRAEIDVFVAAGNELLITLIGFI